MAARPRVCWLDFGYQNLYDTNPHDLVEWLGEAGFDLDQTAQTYEIWTSGSLPNVVLEVLDVDELPGGPVSHLSGTTASSIDEDRRRVCVPLQMDPFFRCTIYSTDGSEVVEAMRLLRDLFAVKAVHCVWEE